MKHSIAIKNRTDLYSIVEFLIRFLTFDSGSLVHILIIQSKRTRFNPKNVQAKVQTIFFRNKSIQWSRKRTKMGKSKKWQVKEIKFYYLLLIAFIFWNAVSQLSVRNVLIDKVPQTVEYVCNSAHSWSIHKNICIS